MNATLMECKSRVQAYLLLMGGGGGICMLLAPILIGVFLCELAYDVGNVTKTKERKKKKSAFSSLCSYS